MSERAKIYDRLAEEPPGFWITHTWESGAKFHFNCPCGCGYGGELFIRQPGMHQIPGITSWEWDDAKRTLTPSIKRHTQCGFHGNLTGGVWKAHEDGAPLAPNVFSNPPGTG